jgi:hypothetical protein
LEVLLALGCALFLLAVVDRPVLLPLEFPVLVAVSVAIVLILYRIHASLHVSQRGGSPEVPLFGAFQAQFVNRSSVREPNARTYVFTTL